MPDCGDNSCRYAENRGGMRTNGGCRCDSCEACDDAMRERAAVVAWLREQRAYGTDELLGQGFANVCGILADAIERGEHRREEKE